MAPIGQASSLCGFTIQLQGMPLLLGQLGLCTAWSLHGSCSFTLLLKESVVFSEN